MENFKDTHAHILRLLLTAPQNGFTACELQKMDLTVSKKTVDGRIRSAVKNGYIKMLNRINESGRFSTRRYVPTAYGLQCLHDFEDALKPKAPEPTPDFVPQIVQPARINVMALPVYVPPKVTHRNEQPPRKQVWCSGSAATRFGV